MITYYRVDERVIHGQTLGVLVRQVPCDAIIIIDDEIASDAYFCNLYKNMVPKGMKVHIFDVNKAMKKLPEAEKSKKNYFVIFKHPIALGELIKRGYRLKMPLMIGPQIERKGTTTFFPTMCLTDEEIKALDIIAETGVKIEMQSILTVRPITWQDAKKNINL